MNKKSTFALFFGNRGFFPESLIAEARTQITGILDNLGYKYISMDPDATRFGAIETREEGLKYAAFLAENRGKYDGVLLILANFGDENGAVTALQDAGTPIFIVAYPDEIGKMDFSRRRDAFCGKFSIMDVFYQYGLPFTVFTPHVIDPATKEFAAQIQCFDRVCRVTNGMKRLTIGALGARTTAFKTVRWDELALQRYGITVDTLDMTEVFRRVRTMDVSRSDYKDKAEHLKNYTNFKNVPENNFDNLVRFGVAIDDLIKEYAFDAISLRCWLEMEIEFGVAPCVLLSDLNDRGIAASCEMDICNAVSMHALRLATGGPATCLDWNNNYGTDPDKCILFHCGPVPQTLMDGKGEVIVHVMFEKTLGAGCGMGCNAGRIAKNDFTFTSSKTENGKFWMYLGEGRFTGENIEKGFFGCGGVAQIEGLQKKLYNIGYQGYRHHTSVAAGHVEQALREAFTRYLKYEITEI
jgi:L-fucose isomerase-like protein